MRKYFNVSIQDNSRSLLSFKVGYFTFSPHRFSMATLDVMVDTPGGGFFEESIERVREEIRIKFAELLECVQGREAALLAEIDDLFNVRRRQIEEFQGRKRELEEMRNQNKSNLNYAEFRSMQQEFMKKVENKIKELEYQLDSFIHFDWNSSLLDEIAELGKLRLVDKCTLTPKVEYKDKLVVNSKRSRVGSLEGELEGTCVICIEPKSGNLLISEKRNNRVQKFDRHGIYLSTLGDKGRKRMNAPDGITVCDDRVYVSQYEGHTVQIYSFSTDTYIGRIGEKGFGAGQLDSPTGLAVSKKDSLLYVCDRGNSRVQVFEQGGLYKIKFGSENLDNPTDIKMTEEEIFVMDEANPCIHVFTYDYVCVRSLITSGVGKQTDDAFCFCLDLERNIYITDFAKDCVSIFNPKGELVHQIGSPSYRVLSSPCGIAIDMLGMVIVVDRTTFGCLRFF